MKLIDLQSDKRTKIYCSSAEIQLIQASLTKIGFHESFDLIWRIYQSKLHGQKPVFCVSFINQGFSNTVVLALSQGKLVGEKFKAKERYILKLGRYKDVEAEISNYSNVVAPSKLPFLPKMIAAVDTIKRWGAILYERLTEVETLQDLYVSEQSAARCKKYLVNLFDALEEH